MPASEPQRAVDNLVRHHLDVSFRPARMDDSLSWKDCPQRLLHRLHKPLRLRRETLKINLDGPEHHRFFVALQNQDNLPRKHIVPQCMLQNPKLDTSPVRYGDRWRHVPLVDKEAPVRCWHGSILHPANVGQGYSRFFVELIQWIE